jgi:hypothetical protein
MVIDKSWLQGIGLQKYRKFASEYKVLITDALFYELTTTEKVQRVNCFHKLLLYQNDYWIIENVGGPLRYEIDNKQPSAPLFGKPFMHKISFNEKIGSRNFCFTKDQELYIKKEYSEREIEETNRFIQQCSTVNVWFPELNGIKPNSSKDIIDAVQGKIVNRPDEVRRIYGEIRKDFYPQETLLDENWAFYRRMQVNLLAGVEYYRKFGPDYTRKANKDFANDFIDMEYCIIASLTDGFATCDKKQASLYQLICPDKILIGRN